MGLDRPAAAAACHNPSPYHFEPSGHHHHQQMDGAAANSSSSAVLLRTRRDDDGDVYDLEFPSTGGYSQHPDGGAHLPTPLTGPIMLNLLTYFIVNLVFASMCLLDSAVKRKWIDLIRR